MKRSIPLVAFVLASANLAFCGGVVTSLTQAELEQSLQGGGQVLFGVKGTLTLTNMITITQNTTLDGYTNSQSVVISGGNAVRLFRVNPGVKFWVKGLVLADGRSVGAAGSNSAPASPGQDAFGAGILSQGGVVTLTDCTLSNHFVQGGNAGTYLTDPTACKGGNGLGAAVYSSGGTLSLTNCVVVGNAAAGGIGGTGGMSTDGGDALGGAIYCEGTSLSLEAVNLANNNATGGAWTPVNVGVNGRGGDGAGGALWLTNSTLLIHSAVVTNNRAIGGSPMGNAISSAPRAGNGLGGAFFVSQGSAAAVHLASFANNTATGGGYCQKFTASGAGRGGAIFNAGTCQVWACTFSGGRSAGGSVAVYTAPGQGGAICSTSDLAVDGCTFVNNSALGGNVDVGLYGPWTAGNGEGGAIWSSGVLHATNSTLTANVAAGGRNAAASYRPGGASSGGGLCVTGATAVLISLTVAGNEAERADYVPGPIQGGGLFATNSTVLVRNSILANHPKGGDVWGALTDGGYNLCSDGTAGFSATGSFNQADPLLGALSGNGGPTATMSLLAGSPARDAIPSGFPSVDQRGLARPQGPAGDMGAFEADFLGAAPTIVTQPQAGTVRAGTNVSLTVGATGIGSIRYQWRKDGQPVSGATSAALTLTNVQAGDAGTYTVLVSNDFGSTPSQGASLVVDSTPLLLTQPTSLVVSPGSVAQFSVLADGPSLSYQWYHDSVLVAGASGTMLTIENALAGAQGSYTVVVSNFAGTATGAAATLTFDSSALSILLPPQNQTAETGYPASFSVLASGIPPFSYQWQRNGTAIAGATASTLSLPGATAEDAGDYTVVVTNGYRSLVSSSAHLTVTPGAVRPVLIARPYGGNLTITFMAEAGRTYRLLSSTDFTQWNALATNTPVAAGLVQFVQPGTAGRATFYRVVTP